MSMSMSMSMSTSMSMRNKERIRSVIIKIGLNFEEKRVNTRELGVVVFLTSLSYS